MPDDKAKKYAQHKYVLFFLDILFTISFLLIYQFFLSENFKILSFSVHPPSLYTALTIYFIIFSLIYYIFSFPLNFYSSYILEHKFSLSNQNFLDWTKDEFKRNAISFIISLLMIHGFYLLLRKSGALWWAWTALAWIVFNIIFAKIFPIFVIPLFYKYSELNNINLKKRIKDLASKASVKLIDVFQINLSSKTKKANAALVGMGKSRRVIIADNLINDFSEDEIETVCAHEFAHHKLFHIWKIIFIFGAFSLTGFYALNFLICKIITKLGASALYDIKIFPMILLILFIFTIFIKPIQNAYSRMLEKEADRFALDLTNNPAAFISLMKKLSKMNLSDENPPKIIKYILYDHPPISERIKMANQ